MKNVVLLDAVRKILETFMVYGKKKSWKLYESENSENLNNHLHRYILFQHSKDKVTALEVLQDDVKYIFQKKHFKNLLLYT